MPNQFGFHVHLEVDTADQALKLDYPEFEIEFTADFDDQPTPAQTEIDIYNLSPSTINRIQKNQAIRLSAGFTGDVGILTQGTITHVAPPLKDGGDEKFTLIMQEGIDYSDDKSSYGKDIDTTFANYTSARTILSSVAQQAGINLQIASLANDSVYNGGYSASGKPIDALQEVAEFTGSKLLYLHGQLMVVDFAQGSYDAFSINNNTGLLTSPTREEDFDWEGYSFDCILNHRLAAGSIINLGSKYVNGQYRVMSGEHTFDGVEARTQLEVK